MIISRSHALRLIRAGKARLECYLKPDESGRVFIAISNSASGRTDHFRALNDDGMYEFARAQLELET